MRRVLENPYGKCSSCAQFLSSEDIYGLCWRCIADGKESKEVVFDKPDADGERNRRQLEAKAQRLKSIFEEAQA